MFIYRTPNRTLSLTLRSFVLDYNGKDMATGQAIYKRFSLMTCFINTLILLLRCTIHRKLFDYSSVISVAQIHTLLNIQHPLFSPSLNHCTLLAESKLKSPWILKYTILITAMHIDLHLVFPCHVGGVFHNVLHKCLRDRKHWKSCILCMEGPLATGKTNHYSMCLVVLENTNIVTPKICYLGYSFRVRQ
jgi:hypothetical protein